MDITSMSAFADELIKIAESPSREANNFFGLPLSPPRRGVRSHELANMANQPPPVDPAANPAPVQEQAPPS